MIILVVALGILAVMALVFMVPVNVAVSVTIGQHIDSRLRLYYFSQFLGWDIKVSGKVGRDGYPDKTAGRESGFSRVLKAVWKEGLSGRVWCLIERLLSAIKLRQLDSDLKISLGEDYYTGMLVGMLLPFTIFLNGRNSVNVKVQPSFEDYLRCEGYMLARFQARPASLVAAVLVFVCSRPALRMA